VTRAAALLAAAALVLAGLAALTGPAAAAAQELRVPESLGEKPAGRVRTGQEVARTAERVPAIRDELRRFPDAQRAVYLKGDDRWQVSWTVEPRGGERREVAQVTIGDATGWVIEAYTGYKVAWTMARGYDGAFGRSINSPWIWVPLAVAFVVPFVDPRRPLRLLHLDLLVLSAFGVSLAFFNAAEVDTSVPIVYPLLVYLLVRMLGIGLRRRRAGVAGAPRLLVPVGWLAIGLVFLVGFRVGLNLTSSNVIDVGYASVVGADRLADGDPLYGGWPRGIERGDTYGPAVYAAYLPFEQALPWSGAWDDLDAAHGAAIAFDLVSLALLFVLGRRIGGTALGVAAAWAWAAFPFTLYVANTNANDAIVPATVLLALLLAGRPAARGAATALAGLTKFAPLALAPLLATHPDGLRPRRLAWFALGFAVVAAALLAIGVDDLGLFWERTIAFQSDRGSPFSVWGLYGWEGAQRAVQVAAVLLALALAVVPRRGDLVGLTALCAAVLIAAQLGIGHWFYLYLVWFFPMVMLAVLATAGAPARSPSPATRPA
jgi:hypothetical protein